MTTAVAVALLGACATRLHLGVEATEAEAGVSFRSRDGFPGQIFVDVTNTRSDPVTVSLASIPVTVAESSHTRTVQTGTIETEVCDEDGVCTVVSTPVYAEEQMTETVEGIVSIAPPALELRSGATATVAVTLVNLDAANRQFSIAIRTRVQSTDGTVRFDLVVPGTRFVRAMPATW